MEDIVKRKVDQICRKKYIEVLALMERGSIVEKLVDESDKEMQLEIQFNQDDEKTIRVTAFISGKHWWDSFYTKAVYECLVYDQE